MKVPQLPMILIVAADHSIVVNPVKVGVTSAGIRVRCHLECESIETEAAIRELLKAKSTVECR